MQQPNPSPPRHLAAIDLDGTLLGPDGSITPENRSAVARLAAAGYEVVLASGRHRQSMDVYSRQLPEVRWIVSSQGAEVGPAGDGPALHRNFLTDADVDLLLKAEAGREISALYYAAGGVLTSSAPDSRLEHYAALSGHVPLFTTHPEILGTPLQKILWLGEPPVIDGLAAESVAFAPGLQTVRTDLRFFEFMPTETTKADALQILADHLGIGAANVVAFGDGENDIPMFEWAGLSYAMPHGWERALAAAKRVAPAGPPETALARAVAELLEECRVSGD